MPFSRQDHNQTWQYIDGIKTLINEEIVDVDITTEVVELGIHSKLRTFYGQNRTFINTPNAQLTNADVVNQVKRLSAFVNGLVRLTTFRDLLIDETVD